LKINFNLFERRNEMKNNLRWIIFGFVILVLLYNLELNSLLLICWKIKSKIFIIEIITLILEFWVKNKYSSLNKINIILGGVKNLK